MASQMPLPTGSQRLEQDAWGVVFCGGTSSRMGRDKAELVFEGRRLIERAVDTLLAVTPSVFLASGDSPRYPELALECVLDSAAGLGPLAGLAAALGHVRAAGIDAVCVLACDMPRVTPQVYRDLLACLRARNADVALLATDKGNEPLCGVYRARTLPAVAAALERGQRRMDAFHGALRVVTIAEEELGHGCARNLNTREDLEAAGGQLT